MKEKVDFTEIKEMCDRFSLDCQIIENGVLITHKKDPWDGVDFARYKFPNLNQFPFFKIKSSNEQMLITEGGYELFKGNCNPIDESDYINQLKKEAFERHDNKLRSDKIDDSMMDGGRIHYGYNSDDEPFTYRKDTDTLYWCGIPVYQSGRWATRVKERIEVVFADYSLEHEIGRKEIVTVQFFCPPFKDVFETGKFLAKQLEEYLNR